MLVPQGPNVLRGDRALADSDFLAGGPNLLGGDRALAATSDLLPGGLTLPGGDRACAIGDPVAGGPSLLQDERMYAAPVGIGHNVSDPGASSGVPANHPLPGPFEEYDYKSYKVSVAEWSTCLFTGLVWHGFSWSSRGTAT